MQPGTLVIPKPGTWVTVWQEWALSGMVGGIGSRFRKGKNVRWGMGSPLREDKSRDYSFQRDSFFSVVDTNGIFIRGRIAFLWSWVQVEG